MIFYIYMKFRVNILNGFKTWSGYDLCHRWTDRQTNMGKTICLDVSPRMRRKITFGTLAYSEAIVLVIFDTQTQTHTYTRRFWLGLPEPFERSLMYSLIPKDLIIQNLFKMGLHLIYKSNIWDIWPFKNMSLIPNPTFSRSGPNRSSRGKNLTLQKQNVAF